MIQDGKLRGFATGWCGQTIPPARFAGLPSKRKDAAQARRLLAIAAVLDGASREEAAKIGGMDRQTLRDWDVFEWLQCVAGPRMIQLVLVRSA